MRHGLNGMQRRLSVAGPPNNRTGRSIVVAACVLVPIHPTILQFPTT
jgi:hypothetical protein